MTTIRVADIVPSTFSTRIDTDLGVNIDTTDAPECYQLLITLVARSLLFLRINGEVFSELGSAIYLIAIRNGNVVVYFIAPVPSNTSEGGEDRCGECIASYFGGNVFLSECLKICFSQ